MRKTLRVCLSALTATVMLVSMMIVHSGEAGVVRDGRELFDQIDYFACVLEDEGSHHQCVAASYVCMCSSSQQECINCGFE